MKAYKVKKGLNGKKRIRIEYKNRIYFSKDFKEEETDYYIKCADRIILQHNLPFKTIGNYKKVEK